MSREDELTEDEFGQMCSGDEGAERAVGKKMDCAPQGAEGVMCVGLFLSISSKR